MAILVVALVVAVNVDIPEKEIEELAEMGLTVQELVNETITSDKYNKAVIGIDKINNKLLEMADEGEYAELKKIYDYIMKQ